MSSAIIVFPIVFDDDDVDIDGGAIDGGALDVALDNGGALDVALDVLGLDDVVTSFTSEKYSIVFIVVGVFCRLPTALLASTIMSPP